jgi:hypothetical protein
LAGNWGSQRRRKEAQAAELKRFDQNPGVRRGGVAARVRWDEEVGQETRRKTGCLYLTRCSSPSGRRADAALQSAAKPGAAAAPSPAEAPPPDRGPAP